MVGLGAVAHRRWCLLKPRWGCLVGALVLLLCGALVAIPVADACVVFYAGANARMGDLGSPPAPWMVPHLARAVRHPLPIVRLRAAESLAVCSEPRCTDLLVAEAAVTSDPRVWAVAIALEPGRTQARRELWKAAAASESQRAHLGLAEALALHGTQDDTDLCLALSQLPTFATRAASMGCLARLSTPETLARLDGMMRTERDLVPVGLDALPLSDSPVADAMFRRYLEADDNALLRLERVQPAWTDPLLAELAVHPSHGHADNAMRILLKREAPPRPILEACRAAADDTSEVGEKRWRDCAKGLRARGAGAPEATLDALLNR